MLLRSMRTSDSKRKGRISSTATTAAIAFISLLTSSAIYLLLDSSLGLVSASISVFIVWMSWAFAKFPKRKFVAAGWLITMSGILVALANYSIQRTSAPVLGVTSIAFLMLVVLCCFAIRFARRTT